MPGQPGMLRLLMFNSFCGVSGYRINFYLAVGLSSCGPWRLLFVFVDGNGFLEFPRHRCWSNNGVSRQCVTALDTNDTILVNDTILIDGAVRLVLIFFLRGYTFFRLMQSFLPTTSRRPSTTCLVLDTRVLLSSFF